MRTYIVRLTIGCALLTAASVPAPAQRPSSGSHFNAAPYAGYMVFGNYLSGPLGSSLSNAGGPVYGIQLSLDLAPNISIIGNAAQTASNLQVGVPFLGGLTIAKTSIMLYDAGLELRMPAGGATTFTPFVDAGAGQMRYSITEFGLTTQTSNFAWNGAAGVDVALSRSLNARLMAKDYVGRFNFKDVVGIGGEGRMAQNWSFSAGLRFAF